jgi:hypothetical protein
MGARLILTGQIRLGELDGVCCAFAMPAPSSALRAPSPQWGEGARTALRNSDALASGARPTFHRPSLALPGSRKAALKPAGALTINDFQHEKGKR